MLDEGLEVSVDSLKDFRVFDSPKSFLLAALAKVADQEQGEV